ncbi:hypothetical protein Trydic_g20083 [Trypoxylus dichotomus]
MGHDEVGSHGPDRPSSVVPSVVERFAESFDRRFISAVMDPKLFYGKDDDSVTGETYLLNASYMTSKYTQDQWSTQNFSEIYSSNVVLRLADFRIYRENLQKKGIYSLATVRANRVPNNGMLSGTTLKKTSQDSYAEGMASFQDVTLRMVTWTDNRLVKLLSTFIGAYPETSVTEKRSSRYRIIMMGWKTKQAKKTICIVGRPNADCRNDNVDQWPEYDSNCGRCKNAKSAKN